LPLANLDVDNLSTLTLNASSPVTSRHARQPVHGRDRQREPAAARGRGRSTAVTQIGTAGNSTTGGSYDVPPNFLLGTGGYVLLYEPETLARTSGNEIPPSRAMSTLSVNNTHDVTLAGGDIAASGLSFPAGSKNLTTGANTVAINVGGALTRVNSTSSGWVAGNLRKDAPLGNSTRAFEVGDAAVYAPVSVNLGSVSFAGTLTARTDGGDLLVPAGSGIDAAKSVNPQLDALRLARARAHERDLAHSTSPRPKSTAAGTPRTSSCASSTAPPGPRPRPARARRPARRRPGTRGSAASRSESSPATPST
jgi:hypothetical protein